ncbi:MAG: hypothetical protein K0R90_1526 [Oscillospiraceae bacterium]|nr:hypothetical protein [Oscillospiraceae bacterium]
MEKRNLKSKLVLSVVLVFVLFVIALFSVMLIKNRGNHNNGTTGSNTAQNVENDKFPSPQKIISPPETQGISLYSITSGKYFYTLRQDKWQCTFLKGINMGLTLPDTDLNEPNIPYDTYMEWFDDISKMGINTIKIFTIMNPDFYRAFYDYNQKNSQKPLYLLHGMWISENDMNEIGDAYGQNEKILKAFKKTAKEVSDIVNGKSDYTSYGSIKKAVYDKDISQYVVGYILGLEWTPDFVVNTNKNNPSKKDFDGRYLYTQNAAAFESFLCEVGDYLIDYETKTYQKQRPIAFLNWSTTDPLKHSNEPFTEEDAVSVDTEKIMKKSGYYAGLFAAIDAYPYYPEFLNYQPEYLQYKDPSTGEFNPYRAYLKDLQDYYTVPAIIAEFGVPTSRGVAHQSVMGYNQGGIDEKQQGEIISNMMSDIAKEQYAGAMIFSWQDEWFKQTWNTVKYAPASASKRTLNVQSAEQRYGILSYEPGEKNACYVDGNIDDWQGQSATVNTQNIELFTKNDDASLYLMGKFKNGFNPKTDKLFVALSTTGRGNKTSKQYNLSFTKPADFLLVLDGEKNTRVLTEAYYDAFYYQYTYKKNIFTRNSDYEKQNSGIFNPINMFMSNEMVLPLSNECKKPTYYEAGLMRFGNSDPNNADFDSLADFYFNEQYVEVKIPWTLLNIVNTIEKKRIADFYALDGIQFESFEKIYIAATKGDSMQQVDMTPLNLSTAKTTTYHKRLKKSYEILKRAIPNIMSEYE